MTDAVAQQEDAAKRRPDRWAYLLLTVLFALFFLALSMPFDGEGADDVYYQGYLSSPLFDGDIDLSNDLYLTYTPQSVVQEFLFRIGPRGYAENYFAIGSPFLWLPFYLPVRGVGWLVQAIAPDPPGWVNDRYSLPYLFAVSLPSLVYGLLAVLLVYRICRFHYGARVSWLATLGAVFASPLSAWLFSYPVNSHPQSAFAAALLVFLCFRNRDFPDARTYLLLGMAAGLATITRWQNVVFVLIPLGFWIDYLLRKGRTIDARGEIARVAAGGAAFAVMVSMQCVYWKILFGKALTIPQGGDFMSWTRPHVGDHLFNGWHGLFYCHPFLLFAFAGLLVFVVRHRRDVYPYAGFLAVALTVYVNAAVDMWWTGGGYGARKFDSCVPLFALGFGALWSALRGRWLILPAAATVLAIVMDVLLQSAVTRGMLDAYYMHEIGLLRGDVIRFLPKWLLTLPLNGYLGNELAVGGHWLRAVVFALLGLALIAGTFALVRGGWFSRLERRGVAVVATVLFLALLVNAVHWAMAPPVDENGVLLSRLSTAHLKPPPPAEQKAIVERIVQNGWRNPAVYYYAYERWHDVQNLPGYLDRVRALDLKTWAKWVNHLPAEQVGPEARAQAAAMDRSPVLPAGFLLLRREYDAGMRGDAAAQRRALKKCLDYNPFQTGALQSLEYVYRTEGNTARAREMRDRRQRALEAKVGTFFAKEEKFRKWVNLLYAIPYHAALMELARLYEEQGEFDKAIALYDKAERRYKGARIPHWRRLALLARTPRGSAADAELIRELDSPDVPADVVALAGEALLGRRELGKALLILRNGLAYRPDDSGLTYWLRRGLLAYPPDRIPFDALMSADVPGAQYWSAVSERLGAAGRWEECRATAARALQSRPNDWFSLYMRGCALYHLDRLDEAESDFRHALEVDPKAWLGNVWLGRVLVGRDRLEEAQAVVDHALAKYAGNKDLEFVLAEIAEAKKNGKR